jgi:AcrR family transcriptional regulator
MPARKLALDRELIAERALALIDRHGLAAFSVRKLGTALGCEAMAIYWHYRNKDAVLDAVVDRLIVPVAAELDDPTDFVSTLRRVAHAYRAIASEHPHAFPLLATRRFASEASYQFLDILFGLARAAGVSDRDAARLYRAVSSYVNGFALNQLAGKSDRRTTLDRQWPRVAAINAQLERGHLDELFSFGLELLLGALDQRPRAAS